MQSVRTLRGIRERNKNAKQIGNKKKGAKFSQRALFEERQRKGTRSATEEKRMRMRTCERTRIRKREKARVSEREKKT